MNGIAELAAALAGVQAELPPVLKNRTAEVKNKEGRYLYSYQYADLADVSAAVLPLLGRHGLAFAAFPGHQPDGKFGLRYYLLHSSGQSIEGFFEIDDQGGMQVVGGRITYARRYTLCAVTGITAEEDVDARGDGRDQPRTAQRKPRAQSSPPAQAASPVAAASVPPPAGAGGDLPPLPGEEDAPGPAPSGRPAGHEPAAGPGAPDATDYDTPGTVTSGPRGQLTAIWTSLSQTFHFGDDEKDQARGVCAQILSTRDRKVELASSKDLSFNQARTVLDTLAHWKAQAEKEDEEPRGYLMLMLEAARKAREEGADGGE